MTRSQAPLVRAVLLGTHDPGSVLHKFRAQSHLLEKILPRTCTCLRRGGTHFESSACAAAQNLERCATQCRDAMNTQIGQRVMKRFQHCQSLRTGSPSKTMAIARSLCDQLRMSKARALGALAMLLCLCMLLGTVYLHINVGLVRLGTPLVGACSIFVAICTIFAGVVKRFGRCIPRGLGNSGEYYLGTTVPIAAASITLDIAVGAAYQAFGLNTSVLEWQIYWSIRLVLGWILGWCTLFHMGCFNLTGDTEMWNWVVPGVGFVPLVLGLCARVVIPLDVMVSQADNGEWELCNGYLWFVMAAMALMWIMVMRCNDNLVIMQAVNEGKLATSSKRLVLDQGQLAAPIQLNAVELLNVGRDRLRRRRGVNSEQVDGACVMYPTKLSLPESHLLPRALGRYWLRLVAS